MLAIKVEKKILKAGKLPILNQMLFSFSTIFPNCSSIVVIGCQSNNSLALPLSIVSEENKRIASASLPNIFATKYIHFTGTGNNSAFFLKALAILFKSSFVERGSLSAIRKISLEDFG